MSRETCLAKTIGRFTFYRDQVLGKGATGSVYRGIDVDTKQAVAVKEIDMRLVNNEVTQYLLEGEKKALSSIENPYVVKTHEIIQESNNCYIVMEECCGGTLKDYITRRGKLPEREALELFRKIVVGYISVIEKLFIHRDLKSANIMLRQNGDPVIIDFGYCQMIMGKRPTIQYNVGSPAYMAPEAYLKHRYSQKSDVWALGVILHQMVTGKTLENDSDMKSFFSKVSQLPTPQLILNEMSSVCKELLTQMLKVEANNRATIHKVKYIIDKSMIPQVQANLNKNKSTDLQLKFKPSFSNKNIEISYIGQKKNAHTERYTTSCQSKNFEKKQCSIRIQRPQESIRMSSEASQPSRKSGQNMPPPPHQPHLILKKSNEKNEEKKKQLLSLLNPIEKVSFTHRDPRTLGSFIKKSSSSFRMI